MITQSKQAIKNLEHLIEHSWVEIDGERFDFTKPGVSLEWAVKSLSNLKGNNAEFWK